MSFSTEAQKQALKTPAFQGVLGFLSNFSPYNEDEYFVFEGITYKSNEHFYQAMKFLDQDKRAAVAEHPFKGLKKYQRAMGHIRDDWDQVKDSVMATGLAHKFTQPRYANLLLQTGDIELVERNNWGDV